MYTEDALDGRGLTGLKAKDRTIGTALSQCNEGLPRSSRLALRIISAQHTVRCQLASAALRRQLVDALVPRCLLLAGVVLRIGGRRLLRRRSRLG